MLFEAFVGLSVLPFILAQSTNDTGLGLEAIEAHFEQSHIVPDLLESFDPSALLTVNYEGVGGISPGEALTEDQVGTIPTVSVTPANSSVSLSGNFTIMMVDADIVGTDESGGVNRHWLENGVTISGTSLANSSAVAITQYAGPGPAAGSGPHRYVILLYSQPQTFQAPSGLTGPVPGVNKFNLSTYVQESNLGPLVAGMYYTVEVGNATVTPAVTSPVITSTLVPPSTSTSSTSTGSQPPKNNNNAMKSGHISFLLVVALFSAATFVFWDTMDINSDEIYLNNYEWRIQHCY
jgi:phosphatidylethanolamine-binding protein (PEBP) family uncharacterized protein